MRTNTLLSIAVISTAACGATPGAHPTDMSQAGHEAAAQEEVAQSTIHAGQFDSSAVAANKHCSGKANTEPCWTSTINPTSGHGDEAEQHRKMAQPGTARNA